MDATSHDARVRAHLGQTFSEKTSASREFSGGRLY